MISILGILQTEAADAQTIADPARKNSVRAGVGINVFGSPSGDRVGPSMYLGYSREIYEYFSIDLQLHADQCNNQARLNGDETIGGKYYNPTLYTHKVGLSLRGMVRPLACVKWLRWLEMGAGVTCQYESFFQGIDSWSSIDRPDVPYATVSKYRKCYFGLDFPIRIYFIDNSRFELFAFYDFNLTMYQWALLSWNSSNGGIMFGVKF